MDFNIKKGLKIYFSQNFKCLVFFFKSTGPVYYIALKFDMKLYNFSSKKHFLHF